MFEPSKDINTLLNKLTSNIKELLTISIFIHLTRVIF